MHTQLLTTSERRRAFSLLGDTFAVAGAEGGMLVSRSLPVVSAAARMAQYREIASLSSLKENP